MIRFCQASERIIAGCPAESDWQDSSTCRGFIAGVSASITYCPMGDVTLGQLRKVAVKFLNDYPERLNEDAALLVMEALYKAFPCKK